MLVRIIEKNCCQGDISKVLIIPDFPEGIANWKDSKWAHGMKLAVSNL